MKFVELSKMYQDFLMNFLSDFTNNRDLSFCNYKIVL